MEVPSSYRMKGSVLQFPQCTTQGVNNLCVLGQLLKMIVCAKWQEVVEKQDMSMFIFLFHAWLLLLRDVDGGSQLANR